MSGLRSLKQALSVRLSLEILHFAHFATCLSGSLQPEAKLASAGERRCVTMHGSHGDHGLARARELQLSVARTGWGPDVQGQEFTTVEYQESSHGLAESRRAPTARCHACA